MAVMYYKLLGWISKPVCRDCHIARATYEKLDESKLGTGEYCTYLCEDCYEKESK